MVSLRLQVILLYGIWSLHAHFLETSAGAFNEFNSLYPTLAGVLSPYLFIFYFFVSFTFLLIIIKKNNYYFLELSKHEF